jgi:hypothetical protein
MKQPEHLRNNPQKEYSDGHHQDPVAYHKASKRI